MKATSSKENILKKIRTALSAGTPIPFPNSEGYTGIFHPSKQELEVEFAENFTRLQGKFIFCVDEMEMTAALQQIIAANKWENLYCIESNLLKKLQQQNITGLNKVALKDCDASITGCENLVARTGSIVMSTANKSGRTTSVYAPVHICIATTSQLVYDVKDALQILKEKYAGNIPSFITFATGPSRTADIEKTLVVGVHGPKEVYVILVDAL